MGATISKEHSPEELDALKEAEAAVWKHYDVQDQLKELQLPLASSDVTELPSTVRLWTLGPDTAEPVLFIHGGGGTPADYAALLPSLLKQNAKNKYRFLLLERPGSGRSDPYDFSNLKEVDMFHAKFLAIVLDTLKITKPIHLVGNSMGGCISVWFAQSFPERIKSLALVAMPAGFEGMKLPFIFYVLGSWVGKQIMARPPPRSLAVDLFATHFHSDMDKVPDVTIDYLWTTQKTRNNSLSWQSLLARIMPSVLGTPSPFAWKLESLPELFPKSNNSNKNTVACLLLLVGSQDTDFMTTEQQSAVGRDLKEPHRYVVMGQGHLPWIEDPEGVAKELFDLWKDTSE